MALILDLIIVVIVVATIVLTIRKGFVKTVLDFASVICAVVLSKMFSPALSSFFYDKMYKSISEKVANLVDNLIKNNEMPTILEHENISAFLGKYNADLSDLISQKTSDSTVEIISQYLVGILSYAVAFFTIFVVVIIAFKILTVIINAIFKLPILKTVNKGLALILGVIVAAVYVMLFTSFMQVMMPFLSSLYPEYINKDIISKTFLFESLYNFEWLKIFVN